MKKAQEASLAVSNAFRDVGIHVNPKRQTPSCSRSKRVNRVPYLKPLGSTSRNNLSRRGSHISECYWTGTSHVNNRHNTARERTSRLNHPLLSSCISKAETQDIQDDNSTAFLLQICINLHQILHIFYTVVATFHSGHFFCPLSY